MCRVVNEHCNCKGSADPSWKNIWLWAALTLLRSHYCTLFSPWLYWAYEVINYGFSHKKSSMGLSEWPETDLLAKSSNLWLTHSSPFRDIIRPSGLVLIPPGNTEERLKLSALRCWISCGWPPGLLKHCLRPQKYLACKHTMNKGFLSILNKCFECFTPPILTFVCAALPPNQLKQV